MVSNRKRKANLRHQIVSIESSSSTHRKAILLIFISDGNTQVVKSWKFWDKNPLFETFLICLFKVCVPMVGLDTSVNLRVIVTDNVTRGQAAVSTATIHAPVTIMARSAKHVRYIFIT